MKQLPNKELTIKEVIDLKLRKILRIPPYQRGTTKVWLSDCIRLFILAVIKGSPIGTGRFHFVNEDKVQFDISDGQQRITHVVSYYQGNLKEADGTKLKRFEDLSTEEQDDFLKHKFTAEVFEATSTEAEKLYVEANSSSQTLRRGEILKAKTYAPAWETLCELSKHDLFTDSDHDRYGHYEVAAFILLNAGNIKLPNDRPPTLYNAFDNLTKETAEAYKKVLETPMASAFEVSQELHRRGKEAKALSKSRKRYLLCQLTIALIGQPKLTTKGASLLADVCLEPEVIQPGEKRASHALNFQSSDTKAVLARFAACTKDTNIFRDPVRSPDSILKDQIREKCSNHCVEGNHPIIDGEEEFHHTIRWEDGGRTDLKNMVLICHKHHQKVGSDQITEEAMIT